jgi:hypothetical protein
MIIRTNVKAGGHGVQHNEKMIIDSNNSIEQKKTLGKKLRLSKDTIRDLNSTDLQRVYGGMLPESKHTYCGGDGCYKPNPY